MSGPSKGVNNCNEETIQTYSKFQDNYVTEISFLTECLNKNEYASGI